MSLREIGKKIGMKNPQAQQIKWHLSHMVKYGFLDIIGGEYKVGKLINKYEPKTPK